MREYSCADEDQVTCPRQPNLQLSQFVTSNCNLSVNKRLKAAAIKAITNVQHGYNTNIRQPAHCRRGQHSGRLLVAGIFL